MWLGTAGSLAALPMARAGLLPWAPGLDEAAAELTPALQASDPAALAAAVSRQAVQRMETVLAGIRLYQEHPYRRELGEPPALWREGAARLLDYGAEPGVAGGRPVLFVPSLINRGYVLDLSPRRSMLRWLRGEGLRPLLLEWGDPGEAERAFGLEAYIARRLQPALAAAAELAGAPVPVVGYCMGGDLTLAAALRRPDRVAGLALLATPWDFHAGRERHAALLSLLEPQLELLLAAFGELPVDLLQALFAGLDPSLAARKFHKLAALDPESEAARDFVALEDWLNDGVALAAPVARECLIGWYGRNEPARGRWLLEGEPVDPGRLTLPSLVAVPAADRIVPPASAAALAAALPAAEVIRPRAGHIGMVVGSRAEAVLWRPLAGWLRALA